MKILIPCNLFYVITLCWCQDDTEFHCSPKPGCQIAQCEATARGWDRPGFNIDQHLHAKEFPITCKSKNNAQLQNSGNILPLVTRNTIEIHDLRKETREHLEKIGEIEKKNMEQQEQINDMEKNSAEQLLRINDLEKKNSEQAVEIKDLRDNNLQQSQHISDQLTEISNLKKAMARFEQKLAAMENTQQTPTTTRQTTKPTTKTPTTLKPIPYPRNCKLKIGNICYFVEKGKVDYHEAVEICKKRNADVGLIRDRESYSAIIDLLRKEILDWQSWIYAWTGLQFNPITGEVTPSSSFTKRYPDLLYTRNSNKDYTNIYLHVKRNPIDRDQGMGNAPPSWKFEGVICEIET